MSLKKIHLSNYDKIRGGEITDSAREAKKREPFILQYKTSRKKLKSNIYYYNNSVTNQSRLYNPQRRFCTAFILYK
ncbi:hypothetical protein RclHR1_01070018 [Rhizophagus clarus]|uniref:Uncharacterized protein n=1 Tax=Rhizophagus clarus TaxID=94130 RepID=A0A2Z6QTN2_9GLOM|nr:hypothetical protein RclHR1_01070018 [Rhizophagus clarus]